MRHVLLTTYMVMLAWIPLSADDLLRERVLTHREQAPLIRSRIETRFNVILPTLMRRAGIDMWIIVSREYNDDPVFRSMAPLTTYSSRRRTILVFFDRGNELGIERISIGRFDYDGLFSPTNDANETQWTGLADAVRLRNPKVIGVNTSSAWNHADGLSAQQERELLKALGPTYSARVHSAEMLAVGWLETKLPEETDQYRHVMNIAHAIIAEAFSNKVIVPNVTTTEDVVWWMRQRVANLGLGQWFHPSVSIQRRAKSSPVSDEDNAFVIQYGDLLHCDFGLIYLGFSTDTQHNAYVLKPLETTPPQGILNGLKAGNKLQDITMQYAQQGVSGNEALLQALAHAKRDNLVPSIYCHAIGYHGHAAGPPIGMWDHQQGVPVRGDYTFQSNTWHSIELNVRHSVPEWDGQQVSFALEEDAALLEDGWRWIAGRQTELYLIH